MQVNYSADTSELDQPAIEAASERPGKSIRVRIPLLLFRLRDGETPSAGVYRSWNNVSWIIECTDADEALALRDGLAAFFDRIKHEGIAAVRDRLTTMPSTA